MYIYILVRVESRTSDNILDVLSFVLDFVPERGLDEICPKEAWPGQVGGCSHSLLEHPSDET